MYYQLQRRAVASFGSYCAPEDLHRVLQTARTAESLKLLFGWRGYTTDREGKL